MIYAKRNVKLNMNVSPFLILQFNLHILSLGRSQGKYENIDGECKLCYVCMLTYLHMWEWVPTSLAPSYCVAAVFTMKNNEITLGALCCCSAHFLEPPLAI